MLCSDVRMRCMLMARLLMMAVVVVVTCWGATWRTWMTTSTSLMQVRGLGLSRAQKHLKRGGLDQGLLRWLIRRN